jgi:predicted DCC family thiol-disulfide oxidoreductase YuxK
MDPKSEILFYDGHCGLCHGAVKFILRRDRDGLFRFAPLQGKTFPECISPEQRASLPDSVVVLTANGNLLMRSDAFLHILRQVGGERWRMLANVIGIVPRGIRDAVYNFIARVRYRIFGRKDDLCPMIPPGLRDRFLD